jgi:CRP-like cAMP-binding protein/predicted acylesterase/phospholipase RssA
MQDASIRRALVLSGGGARGAYEAGVVAALCEREQFDIVCGTSIGAINAALTAQGATDRLQALWRSVPERALIRGISPLHEMWAIVRRRDTRWLRKAFQLAADVARGLGALRYAQPKALRGISHLLDPAPIVAMLRTVLNYDELSRTLIVGVTNLTLARPEAFYSFPAGDAAFERRFAHSEGASVKLTRENSVSAILASAAIPLAFPKVQVPDDDGRLSEYIDGGIGNNTPIRQAIDAGADEITVVIADHIALRDRTHRTDDLGSIALVAQDIMQQQVLELDLKLTRRVNEGVLRGSAPGKRFVRIRTIGPSVPIPLPILGFANLETIDRAFEQGLVDGHGACDASGLSRLFASDPSARTVRAGEIIYREGESAAEMYVALTGEFDASFHGRTIATFSPGDMFGELAILGTHVRRSGVIARTDGLIAPVDRDRFCYLVQYAPSFALTVLRSLVSLLSDINETAGLKILEPLASDEEIGEGRYLEALRDGAATQSFAPGQPVFKAGDPGDSMFLVLEGQVDMQGDESNAVASARRGDVFGEMALSDGRARNVTATAVSQTRVLPIDDLRFRTIVENNPNFAVAVMQTIAKRMMSRVDSLDSSASAEQVEVE